MYCVIVPAMRLLKQAHEREQGYVSSDELMNIPELSINPLARRLERLFDSINFKVRARSHDLLSLRRPLPRYRFQRYHGVQEFVGLLAAFSPKAGRAEKLQFLFTVHDIDGDGMLSSEDLQLMLRQLAGTSLRSVHVAIAASTRTCAV